MTLDEAFQRLRAVNQPVPKPPRLPTEEEVLAAERELGVSFPHDYRRFLLEACDIITGVLEPAVVQPGVSEYRDLIQVARQAWERGVPRDVLAFCYDNGNYHFINAAGEVGFWDHDDQSERRGGTLADWIVEVWLEEE